MQILDFRVPFLNSSEMSQFLENAFNSCSKALGTEINISNGNV